MKTHADKSRQYHSRPASLMPQVILFCMIILINVSAFYPSKPASKIDPILVRQTAEGKTVRFLVLFRQQNTMASDLQQNPRAEGQPAQLIDRLQQSATQLQAPVKGYLDGNRIRYHSYWIVNMIALEGDLALIEQIASFPSVMWIEPDPDIIADLGFPAGISEGVTGFDSPVTVQPNLAQVHAPEVWARGETGDGSVIAVADTGVLWTHAALINQYRGWDGSTSVHDYNWWDAIHGKISGLPNKCGYNLTFPCDDYGHGTHVTGIAAGNDGLGNQIGMAPGARWIACRNMDNGVGRPSTYIECLQFFAAPTDLAGQNPRPDLRPDVINNSYSCPSSELCTSHSLQQAVENVRAAGIFMSVSAGNGGPACGTINTPPALEEAVFTIGAVNSTNTIASFSSRGPVTVDGTPLMKPNLVAPGVSIYSALYTGGYGTLSGTSMAAPHISGAIALLWGAYPFLRRDVGTTETLLEQTAIPLTTTQGCGGDLADQVPNNVYGWGLVNVKAAYDAYWPVQPKLILLPIFTE